MKFLTTWVIAAIAQIFVSDAALRSNSRNTLVNDLASSPKLVSCQTLGFSHTTSSGPSASHADAGLTCEKLGWPRAQRARRVIDAFAYNGEIDILDARMRELSPVVNDTAILTTELNFHGEPHSQVRVPSDSNVMHKELEKGAFQECAAGAKGVFSSDCACALTKNSVANVVEELHPDDDDWVIFSDVDEIPNREIIRLLHECEVPVQAGAATAGSINVIKLLSQAHYMFDTHCLVPESHWASVEPAPQYSAESPPRGPALLKVKTMRRYGMRTFQYSGGACTENGPHATCWDYTGNSMVMGCSAWHLSSFGGSDMVSRKVEDNKDDWSDFSKDRHRNNVKKCIEDNLSRNAVSKKTDVLNQPLRTYPDVPHSVAEDPQRFSVFFGK